MFTRTESRKYHPVRYLIRFASVAIAAIAFASQSLAAILIFENSLSQRLAGAAFDGVGPDYGDNIASTTQDGYQYDLTYGPTPNVSANYKAGVFGWDVSYGDLVNVAYASNSDHTFELVLTATPGFVVRLHSFDMAGWPTVDRVIDSVKVLDGGNNVLFTTSSPVTIEGIGGVSTPTHSDFDFTSPLSASILKIRFTEPASPSTVVGIDNIAISQTLVPEPLSFVVWGCLIIVGIVVAKKRVAILA